MYIKNDRPPMNLPISRVQHNGPGTDHVSRNESGAVLAVDPRYLYLVQFTLHPVDLLPDPVNSQTLSGGQSNVHYRLNVSQSCHNKDKGNQRNIGNYNTCTKTCKWVDIDILCTCTCS